MHKRATRKSCLIQAPQWAAVENIQPENCSSVPVAAPALSKVGAPLS